MDPIKIVIFGSNVICRGIINILSHFDDIQVIGNVNDFRSLHKLLQHVNSHIVLVDALFMSTDNEGKLFDIIASCDIPPYLIVMLDTNNIMNIPYIWFYGMKGIITRNITEYELHFIIRQVSCGRRALSSDLQEEMIQRVIEQEVGMVLADVYIDMVLSTEQIDEGNNTTDYARKMLSPTEQNVFDKIIKGKSNREIANDLYVSINTVKTHVKRILIKLDLKKRQEIIHIAMGIPPVNINKSQ